MKTIHSRGTDGTKDRKPTVEIQAFVLLANIQKRVARIKPPKTVKGQKAEYWKAGARFALATVNTAIEETNLVYGFEDTVKQTVEGKS